MPRFRSGIACGFVRGCHQCVVEAFYLLTFTIIDAVESKRLRACARRGCGGMAHSVSLMMLRLVLFGIDAHPLHRQQGILGTAISFLANAGFLAPEIAINGVTLRHFVVA